jgi:hypothetical protein
LAVLRHSASEAARPSTHSSALRRAVFLLK